MLLAYAKMTLYEDLLRTELPERAYFVLDLAKYFPRPLRRRFAEPIKEHRLKREIAATWIANSVVNRGLAVFVSELEDETGGSLEDVLLAYVTTRDAFGLLQVWAAIEALPASVSGRAADAPVRGGARRGDARYALVRHPGRSAVQDARHGVSLPAGHRDGDGQPGRGDRAAPRGGDRRRAGRV